MCLQAKFLKDLASVLGLYPQSYPHSLWIKITVIFQLSWVFKGICYLYSLAQHETVKSQYLDEVKFTNI
jgi:hypothetical protein